MREVHGGVLHAMRSAADRIADPVSNLARGLADPMRDVTRGLADPLCRVADAVPDRGRRALRGIGNLPARAASQILDLLAG